MFSVLGVCEIRGSYTSFITKIEVVELGMDMLTFLHRFGQGLKMSEYLPNSLEKIGILVNRSEMSRSNLTWCTACLKSGHPLASPSSRTNSLIWNSNGMESSSLPP